MPFVFRTGTAVQALKDHSIEFVGLKDGLHDFRFVLDDAFFAAAADEELHGGACTVDVKLDKNPNLLVADPHRGHRAHGLRPLQRPLDQPVDGKLRQVYHPQRPAALRRGRRRDRPGPGGPCDPAEPPHVRSACGWHCRPGAARPGGATRPWTPS
ncbi:MAG: hypothetical protein IPM68_01240 [Flavobacteriales bacterium]|nr:hypothetical protein [Flavobacteriales bacterium]